MDPAPSPLYVGVDGGATRSRTVALDRDGREAGRVEGPACLVSARDPAAAAARVADGVRELAAHVGVRLPVARLVAGLAGAGRSETSAAVREALLGHGVAASVEVLSDGAIALEDAFGAGPGILVVGGTGSLALGRAADGREARAGGWGATLGDEGSGWWLGLHALRAVARAADGRGRPTALTGLLLPHLGLEAPERMIRWVEGATKRDVASLAPLVLQAAAAGDPAARRLAATAARDLARAAHAVRCALEPWPEPPPVAGVGGLIAPGGGLRDRLARALAARGLRLAPAEVVPARGAARRAWHGA